MAMPQENYDLINDAAHGIGGSCAVGHISLQGSQPVLNMASRIFAPSLAGTSYETLRAVKCLSAVLLTELIAGVLRNSWIDAAADLLRGY
ncbi:MAG: hypothetical protein FRX49_03001 [Trebouxia sp. A1-2]|nr:MAG: hypothetical protein FRX49_03001 [Trebouxia sp. A1-2]